MKICHVTSAHKTTDGRIFLKECTSLAKNSKNDVYLVGQGKSRIENNVHVIGIGEMPSGRLQRMLLFSKKVVKRALSVDAEVYHLHDPELLRLALKLKKKGAAVIFDSHENVLDSIDEKTYMPILVRRIAKKYYAVLQKHVLPKLDAVIVVSPQMINSYATYNNRIVMITNYPIVVQQSPMSGIEEQKGTIIFAGGISPQWSIMEIIQAIHPMKDLHLFIYGNADQDYLKKLENSEYRDAFTYGGSLPFNEIQQRIKESEMVVALLKPGKNTFYHEGTLGNTKLFEAMLNEKPLVATGFDIWEDIIEKNECGICANPDNVESIMTAISTIHSMTAEERKLMGNNGRKLVLEKYNWQVEENVLNDLYEQLS